MNQTPPRRSELDLPLPFDDLGGDGPLALPPVPVDWHLGMRDDGTFSPVLYARHRAAQRARGNEDERSKNEKSND